MFGEAVGNPMGRTFGLGWGVLGGGWETQWVGHLGLVGLYWERSIGEDLEEEEEKRRRGGEEEKEEV